MDKAYPEKEGGTRPSLQTNSVARRLRQRVMLLSLITILGLIAVVVLGLSTSLLNAQRRLDEAGTAAAQTFDSFLGAIRDDMRAISGSLVSTEQLDLVFRRALERQSAIFEIILADPLGNILAQRRRVGGGATLSLSEQPWLAAVQAGEFYVGPVDYAEYGIPFVDIAVAVTDQPGNFTGTLLARVDLTTLWVAVTQLRVEETGYVYITDSAGQLLSYRDLQLVKSGVVLQDVLGRTPQAIATSEINLYTGLGGHMVIASGVPLSIIPWFVIVEQSVGEALPLFMWLAALLLVLLVVVILLVVDIVRFTARRIVSPLLALRRGVDMLRRGDMAHRIDIQSEDELGDLASTFNTMAAQLQDVIGTLEQRVAERTHSLQAAAEVARAASSVLDLDELLEQVVALINDQFSFYHTSLFLIEEDQSALLHTDVGSQGPLFRGQEFRLAVDESSMVGWCMVHQQPRVAADVSAEEVYVAHPLLPDTHSEIALPLIARGRLIGALDVQSTQADAFDEATVAVMQTMANQVAIAIENAQLYEELRTRAEWLAEANLAATAANKELEAFSYSVSHDLRAPLRHIEGFVQLLLRREEERLDQTSSRYLNVIVNSAAKMGQLIDELLAFSRTGRAEMQIQRVELDALVRETRQELASISQDRLVTWEVGPLPSVEADPILLRQVWMNLLSNALKFTTPRAEARIEIGAVKEYADAPGDKGEATIFVRDNGVGFDPKYAHKLFGVFQRLHREDEFEGTGIGLATVRRIVQRHGGRIWAESKLDQGATFYFTLKEAQGE